MVDHKYQTMTTTFKEFLGERIYSTGDDLVISIQHSKETSTEDAISTFFRRNPYRSHLQGAEGIDVYSILNYVSSPESTKLMKSIKGKGPYTIKPRQYELFLEQLVDQVVKIFGHLRPDIVITPRSSSTFVNDIIEKLVRAYPKAKYFTDSFIKRALDAENIEPLIRKDHPDWEKFSSEHPKDADSLRKALKHQIKTTGGLELKKLYKPYLKFIKNFVELKNADELLDRVIDHRVIVLDDVLSSGATMVEMLRQIKELEPTYVGGLTIFKRTVHAIHEAISKAHEYDIDPTPEEAKKSYTAEQIAKLYMEKMSQPGNSEYEFGSDWKDITEKDPAGCCSMISNHFHEWLGKFSNLPRTAVISGYIAKDPQWAKNARVIPGDGEDAHTVVRFGDKIIDFTAKQFERTAPVPRIVPYSKFKSEWKKAD